MAMRGHSGRLVVAGVLVIAVGGAIALNKATEGPPPALDRLLHPPTGSPPPTVRVTPSSGPATPGRSVEVRILTECGLVPAVDFDGSFWFPGNGRTMATVGLRLVPPVDPATVTLQAPNSALLRTASGQAVVLERGTLGTAAMPVCD